MSLLLHRRSQTVYAPGGGSGGGGGGVTGLQGIDSGVESLSASDESVAVAFTTPFSGAPAVSAIVISPDGSGFVIDVVADESTRTENGVTFLLGAAIPGAGYKLSWIATGVVSGPQGLDSGVEDLSETDESLAVVFAFPFVSAPAVVATIISPTGAGYVIDVVADESTRTENGVTFLFGAAIPGAGYKLSWIASGT